MVETLKKKYKIRHKKIAAKKRGMSMRTLSYQALTPAEKAVSCCFYTDKESDEDADEKCCAWFSLVLGVPALPLIICGAIKIKNGDNSDGAIMLTAGLSSLLFCCVVPGSNVYSFLKNKCCHSQSASSQTSNYGAIGTNNTLSPA